MALTRFVGKKGQRSGVTSTPTSVSLLFPTRLQDQRQAFPHFHFPLPKILWCLSLRTGSRYTKGGGGGAPGCLIILSYYLIKCMQLLILGLWVQTPSGVKKKTDMLRGMKEFEKLSILTNLFCNVIAFV